MIAPYDATSSEQLSLQRGQLVLIRKKTDSGWWEGELQAKGRKKQVLKLHWFTRTNLQFSESIYLTDNKEDQKKIHPRNYTSVNRNPNTDLETKLDPQIPVS